MGLKRVLALVSIGVLILMVRNMLIATHKLSTERAQISNLTQELRAKKKEHGFLTEKLLYVKSSEFIEQEAREKLGMTKIGERVVIAPPPTLTVTTEELPQKTSNWEKWWSVFF